MESKKQSYKILDVGVSIESDSAEFLQLFDDDYHLFKTQSINETRKLDCFINLDGNNKDTFLKINNKVYPLNGHPDKQSYIYKTIVKRLTNEVKDFFLLHAGVVVRNGKAVIISGPPGVGKTTLTLKLLQEGFAFFSDEYCPINKETRLIHPFPRSVWIANKQHTTYGSSSRLEGNSLNNNGRKRKKVLIKPYDLRPFVGNEPGKAKCLVCIDTGNLTSDICVLEIGLRDGEKAILHDLEQLNGIDVERLSHEFSEWRIKYKRDKALIAKIKGILDRYERQIWDVYSVDPIRADYDKEPAISQISNHEVAFRLIREFRQWPDAKADENMPGRVFMEFNELFDGISCYRLSIGKLEVMKDLILEVFTSN